MMHYVYSCIWNSQYVKHHLNKHRRSSLPEQLEEWTEAVHILKDVNKTSASLSPQTNGSLVTCHQLVHLRCWNRPDDILLHKLGAAVAFGSLTQY